MATRSRSTLVGALVLMATPARATSLATFTLVRGGSSWNDYSMFEEGRRCLHEAMRAGLRYDDVAFHEGNVPTYAQHAMQADM